MNFFFAILIFMIVGLIGEKVQAPQLGDIASTTKAFEAGFRSGDTVTSVDGKKIETYDQLKSAIEARPGQNVEVVVERDSQPVNLSVQLERTENQNVMSWADEVGTIEGLNFVSRTSLIGVTDPKSAAAQAGLKPGDFVVSVNGQKIDKWRELLAQLEKNNSQSEISLGVRRDYLTAETETPAIPFTLKVPNSAKGKSGNEFIAAVGIEDPELYLIGFDQPKPSLLAEIKAWISNTEAKILAPAERAGLKFGDKLVAIDGQPVNKFEQVSSIVRAHTDATKPIQIAYLRDGKRSEVSVQPNQKERMGSNFKEETRFEIGIRPMLVSLPSITEWKSNNVIEALQRGWSQSVRWTNITILGFVRLFEGRVSPKNVGGFFSIGQMAQNSWAIGAFQFLNVMAIISLNLFILNLLPVPVLDGGHLVFFTIEAIKGAPLSLRKMEIAQQVGMVLLLSLMVFALFNDFSRMFGGS